MMLIRGAKTIYIEVYMGIMELRCRHEKYIGKAFQCPPIKLTKNETNILNHGTFNDTINNYSNIDDQLIEFQKYDIFENKIVSELVYQSLTGTNVPMTGIVYHFFKDKCNIGENIEQTQPHL
jgi:hypothetical protein